MQDRAQDDREPAPKRPRFCNYFSCPNSSCSGLCYNFHAHCDSQQIVDSEIESVVCGEKSCLKEYCSNQSCRCFWKLQNEVASGRERSYKMVEKLQRKIQNFEAEVSVLRASKNSVEKPSFAEEVSKTFGHHFHLIKNLEQAVRQDFSKTLYRFERDREQAFEEVERMKKENAELRLQKTRLEKENRRLLSICVEVQPDLRSTS